MKRGLERDSRIELWDKTVGAFQEKYPTNEEREKALKLMSNEEIDNLISGAGTVQAKIYYSSFKKK